MKLVSKQNKPVTIGTIPKEEKKRLAYAQEADPLFFKWQRGEATKEDWLAKVKEVDERSYE